MDEDFENWMEWKRLRLEVAALPLLRWGKSEKATHLKNSSWHITLGGLKTPVRSECGRILVVVTSMPPPLRICKRCRHSPAFEDVWG
jgi:hypothetical protein